MRSLAPRERAEYRAKMREEMWKQRAGEGGMAAPTPPLPPRQGARSRMSPEEWQAYREQRHAQMKERMDETGVPFPEEPPAPGTGWGRGMGMPGYGPGGFGPYGPGGMGPYGPGGMGPYGPGGMGPYGPGGPGGWGAPGYGYGPPWR